MTESSGYAYNIGWVRGWQKITLNAQFAWCDSDIYEDDQIGLVGNGDRVSIRDALIILRCSNCSSCATERDSSLLPGSSSGCLPSYVE